MNDSASSFLNIRSEIGRLKSILLHRPSRELEQLIPKYLDEMLFEDIPYLAQMQEEHDFFAQTLRSRGVEVLYFEELLKDILEDQTVRNKLVDEVVSRLLIHSDILKTNIKEALKDKSPVQLSAVLLAGLEKNEIRQEGLHDKLSFYIKDDYPFYIDPLPNLYFARDYGTVIGNKLSVNSMKARARQRESLLLQYIAENHKRFTSAEVDLWHRFDEKESIEGGDILILSESVAAIGCSARTSAEGIEILAERLLTQDEKIKEIIVVQIPFTRAYMHLDTVFTMVDYDKFTIFPGVAERLNLFSLTVSDEGRLRVRPKDSLEKTLSTALGLPAVKLIETGGGDALTAEREQWNDSTNTLALSPGTVVTYRRNIVSNDILDKNGVEVVEIRGSELVRGRGGPRCMSMPLNRIQL